MKLFKKNKGYTLIEVLLAIGVIGALTAMTYSFMSKKYLEAQADSQVKEILSMDSSIQQMMVNVTAQNNTAGVAQIESMLTPANLIANNVIPAGRVSSNGNTIKNMFKNGTLTFTAEALNVSTITPRVVPVYSYVITDIPSYACSFIVTNYQLSEYVRIKVDSTVVKTVGNPVSPTEAAVACSSSNNKTIEITQSSIASKPDYGTQTLDLTGATGHIRDSESPLFQEQLRTNTSSGACPAGSWNGALSYCSCPAGTEWDGKACIAMGQPGHCVIGMMWDLTTKTCVNITKAPFPGVDVTPRYENGRYVPGFTENPLQMPTGQGLFACEGPLPPNAAIPENGAGSYDGSICNKCINGAWDGSRCVIPQIKN